MDNPPEQNDHNAEGNDHRSNLGEEIGSWPSPVSATLSGPNTLTYEQLEQIFGYLSTFFRSARVQHGPPLRDLESGLRESLSPAPGIQSADVGIQTDLNDQNSASESDESEGSEGNEEAEENEGSERNHEEIDETATEAREDHSGEQPVNYFDKLLNERREVELEYLRKKGLFIIYTQLILRILRGRWSNFPRAAAIQRHLFRQSSKNSTSI